MNTRNWLYPDDEEDTSYVAGSMNSEDFGTGEWCYYNAALTIASGEDMTRLYLSLYTEKEVKESKAALRSIIKTAGELLNIIETNEKDIIASSEARDKVRR